MFRYGLILLMVTTCCGQSTNTFGVQLLRSNKLHFGGSLINSQWVLSLSFNKKLHGQEIWTAHALLDNLEDPNINIEKIVEHPTDSLNLFKLESQFDISPTSDVANYDSKCPSLGQKVTFYGIGKISQDLDITDIKNCQSFFSDADDSKHICVPSNKNGNLITGPGSGLPLVASCNGKQVVVGLAYKHRGYCKSNCHTLFIRVSAFAEWIKNTIKNTNNE